MPPEPLTVLLSLRYHIPHHANANDDGSIDHLTVVQLPHGTDLVSVMNRIIDETFIISMKFYSGMEPIEVRVSRIVALCTDEEFQQALDQAFEDVDHRLGVRH